MSKVHDYDLFHFSPNCTKRTSDNCSHGEKYLELFRFSNSNFGEIGLRIVS